MNEIINLTKPNNKEKINIENDNPKEFGRSGAAVLRGDPVRRQDGASASGGEQQVIRQCVKRRNRSDEENSRRTSTGWRRRRPSVPRASQTVIRFFARLSRNLIGHNLEPNLVRA